MTDCFGARSASLYYVGHLVYGTADRDARNNHLTLPSGSLRWRGPGERYIEKIAFITTPVYHCYVIIRRLRLYLFFFFCLTLRSNLAFATRPACRQRASDETSSTSGNISRIRYFVEREKLFHSIITPFHN